MADNGQILAVFAPNSDHGAALSATFCHHKLLLPLRNLLKIGAGSTVESGVASDKC
jgi:hypothetical protein